MHRTIVMSSIALLAAAIPAASVTLDADIAHDGWLRTALEQVSAERMMADIVTLSSPAYRGRQTGSEQDRATAEWVARRFGELRLRRTPAPPPESHTVPLPIGEWTQTASVTVTTIQEPAVLRVDLSGDRPDLRVGEDFLPVLDSPSADIPPTPVVFVGYGLASQADGYDDYAGLDVADRIVLFLRGKPEWYSGPATHADKERLARAKGARGYLMATGPMLSVYDARRGVTGRPSAFYGGTPETVRLPGAWISTEQADAIVARSAGHPSLRALQEEMTKARRPRSRVTDVVASMQWDARSVSGTLYNVASMIRGSSPRADEAVIIGAHRDHFGVQAGLLFAGADDNASGTAVLLEVARLLAEAPAPPKRSILFLSFSGEEQGLWGSRLYVSHPLVPLSDTIAMINVDHAGIGNGRLTVGVTKLDAQKAVEAGQTAGFANLVDFFGFFPGGDHVPFKEADVPTITVVSGGMHPHFHQPTDRVETLDPALVTRAARYVLALAWHLANTP